MMYMYTRMMLLRLIWIITTFIFMVGCSSVALAPPNKIPVPSSNAEKQLLLLAEQHFKKGEFEPALKKLQQIHKGKPNNVEAIYHIAEVYFALDKYTESLEYSKRAAAYKVEHLADIYLLMGRTYERLDEPWDALRTYRYAASEYPENPIIQYRLGATYVYLNKPEFAAESFIAAIQTDPYHAASHFQLGTLYYTNDYNTPALLALSMALLLETNHNTASLIRKDIKELLGRESVISKIDEGDFQSVDTALVRQRASLLKKPDKYTTFEIIKAQYHTLFKELNTEKIKNQNKTFVLDIYVPFYNKVDQQVLAETFVYYIFQDDKDKAISNWLAKHPEKIKQLEQLVKKHNWISVNHNYPD